MPRLQDIGVAMIGTGFMCTVHVEALKRVGVNVRGVIGSTPEKSVASAERLNLPNAYATYTDVLKDSTVHAVHLGVPNRLHLPMAKEALYAGKHVLCEKPLAMDSAELLALAKAHPHLATGVNYNVRYYALCHDARERIRSGELERIFHITGSVSQDWLLYDTDYNWRVLSAEGGELRAISVIGSHWLDLIQDQSTATRGEISDATRFCQCHSARTFPRGGSHLCPTWGLWLCGTHVLVPPQGRATLCRRHPY
jgi:predicted dehydrogenase